MSVINKILVLSIPLLTCYLIPLFSMIYFDLNAGKLQKEIYSDLAVSIKHAVFDSPPFVVISIYTYYLIRKERSQKEISIKMSCMLLPIAVFSFYWSLKYILSPLALGFLPFINLPILVPGWLIGIVVNNACKDTNTK